MNIIYSAASVIGVIVAIVVFRKYLSSGKSENSSALLPAAEFYELYKQTSSAVILDVRRPDEYNEAHISGAMNVDVENPDFESNLQKLDKAKTYFVHCRSGVRSARATGIMHKRGFAHIVELQGGILAAPELLHLKK